MPARSFGARRTDAGFTSCRTDGLVSREPENCWTYPAIESNRAVIWGIPAKGNCVKVYVGEPTSAFSVRGIAISDDHLLRISEENEGWQVERDDDGSLIMSPNFSPGGFKSGEAHSQLDRYAKRVGGKAGDASTGYTMPTGAVLSPDASWVSPEQVASVPLEGAQSYWKIVPVVVIEIRSASDAWSDTTAKVDRFLSYGATYAVAVDPETREVYERGSAPAGLSLDFDAIIDA